MSSNDQQHPYGQDPSHSHGYGHEPGHDPLSGRQPQPSQPYGDQAYGQQPYGEQSYGGQSYGGQTHGAQPYGDQSYGGQTHGAQPYGDQSYGGRTHGQQASYGAPQQAYGTYDPNQAPQAGPAPAWPTGQSQEGGAPATYGPQDPGVTQTWEGQTWDTQYQPTIEPAQPAQPVQPVQPVQPAQQPVPATAGTSSPPPLQQHAQPQHPQPQGASGSHPLPPEAPAPAASRAAEPDPAAVPAGGPSAGTAASALDAAGYSAPTTLGNSRVTDAQRARAEGRSPIIAPGMQPAALTAGLGLLLALGAAIGPYALVVPLVLLQAVTAAGWFRLNGMWPARQGIVLAFAGGLVADIALLAAGRENGPAAILGTLGIWVLLTVVLQLRSHASADERMQGLMATVASAALSVLAAGHLAAVPDAVTAGAVAVAVAVLVRALPLTGPASVVVALLAAAGAGAVAGALTDLGTKGALLGVVAGGCALIGLRVASYDYPSRFVHMTAGVALPLTAAAPAVYLLGRAIS
ncbi:hypothetical protein ACF08M_31565 [Streptomyces sp. NPDC015032]|uniref:hypothetical protein n=1 Tax=Streptomyces sp. NPDC015032 TaxID=3364937 RepID=UPI0036FD88EC